MASYCLLHFYVRFIGRSLYINSAFFIWLLSFLSCIGLGSKCILVVAAGAQNLFWLFIATILLLSAVVFFALWVFKMKNKE